MADIKFKMKRLTLDQKELRKLMRKKGAALKKEIKSKAPKVTGALKHQIDFKVKARGGYRVTVVVGVVYKGEWKGKIATLYATKVNLATGFISDSLNKRDIDDIQADIKDKIDFK